MFRICLESDIRTTCSLQFFSRLYFYIQYIHFFFILPNIGYLGIFTVKKSCWLLTRKISQRKKKSVENLWLYNFITIRFVDFSLILLLKVFFLPVRVHFSSAYNGMQMSSNTVIFISR